MQPAWPHAAGPGGRLRHVGQHDVRGICRQLRGRHLRILCWWVVTTVEVSFRQQVQFSKATLLA